ncbi:hypothetical protein R1sor_018383 [Riccia sorocarpa]|uniref:Protein kinase domain-containing protein n=1 Tax=Riccia sorocarpa TaxID=122646 RepID=A0ABD3IDL9_9MARC
MAFIFVAGLSILLMLCSQPADAQEGFISIDCGEIGSQYTDARGITWVPDSDYIYSGMVENVSTGLGGSDSSNSRSLQTLRYFSSDDQKHCYTVGPVNVSMRYLMRASFLYENYDGADTFPSFQISLGTSPWATVNIINASAVYVEELVAVATDTSFLVCLYKGSTGNPFISSLELRPLAAGMYSVPYLGQFFLRKTARINFSALSADAVRFPDDHVDRIWTSDLVYPLQDEAPGTHKINTTPSVDVTITDHPSMSVMQTAVVGGSSGLSYRLNLEGYPAPCYAVIYFAEIEVLRPNQTRAFFFQANIKDSTFDGAVLNLARDAGPFKAFEPGYINVTFPAVVTIQLLEDKSSTLPPLINALEIYQIMPNVAGTFEDDVTALSTLIHQLPPSEVPGDPCLPEPWAFLTKLSSRNLTGSIPSDIGRMTRLVDLWLDNNQLTGNIPDLSQLSSLRTLQQPVNMFYLAVPADVSGGVVALGGALLALLLWMKLRKKKKKAPREPSRLPFHEQPSLTTSDILAGDVNPLGDGGRVFRLEELVEATDNFNKQIGSGGFGPVYYGRLADGEEIAVKVMSASSTQGGREFYNEVEKLLMFRDFHCCICG